MSRVNGFSTISSDACIASLSHVDVVAVISESTRPIVITVQSVHLIRVFFCLLLGLGSHAAEAVKSTEIVLYLEIKNRSSYLQVVLYLW
jgi:hypothetical protein